MFKRLLYFVVFSLLIFTASADILIPGQSRVKTSQPQHSRGFSFEQYQENKCNFIIQELELSPEEVERFLPVYKQLLQEKSALYHQYGGSHRVMRSVSEGQQVPDSTMQRAAQNARKLQLEDAKLEEKYLSKFEQILKPVQIIRLQEAEQKFKNEMMKRAPRHQHER